MLKDRYGLSLSTASTLARDAFVDGVDRFLAAQEGTEAALRRAIAADPNFALARIALARHLQTCGRAAEAAPELAAARAAEGLSERETSHIAALTPLLEGRGAAALPLIRAHLETWPRDVMVAQPCAGVFGLIGFSGEAGREAALLAFMAGLAPHYGKDWWFLTQFAFAEIEAGRTAPGAARIEGAFALNPRNANAAHILAHLLYEQGEIAEGRRFLAGWREDYAREGVLHTHIAWHGGLWALESGDTGEMWRIYAADIDPGAASGPPLNVLTDAAALLFRAELAGERAPEGAWARVADYAAARFPDPGLAFADVHAALAHAMAGNGEALVRLATASAGAAPDLVRGLAEAFRAFAAADWAGALAAFVPALRDHARIGGSRAQRDLIEFAAAAALLRLGKAEEARRFLAIRRPLAPPNAVAGLA